MPTSPARKALPPELLEDIRSNWIGDDASSPAEANRRIRACQAVATAMAADMRRQLARCHAARLETETRYRAVLLGYANGMSEAMLRESGECSRWAIELISLGALHELQGPAWDEDTTFGEAQRLWCQKNPDYLAGIRAARSDHGRHAAGETLDGLATCIERRDAIDGVDRQDGFWLRFL